MRFIFAFLVILGVNVHASSWLIDPNTILCAAVGENTMNGDPVSFDKSTCTKLSEYNDSFDNPVVVSDSFCEFDYNTGEFKTNYGEIPAAVAQRYNNRKYTGWAGNVKLIEDKINMGIEILQAVKQCNIEASQYLNEYAKRKSVEGFDKIGFLYNSSHGLMDDYQKVIDFISTSMDMYDCNYNCEVHREGGEDMGARQLLDGLGNNTYSLNEPRSNALYSICKTMKTGCLDFSIDNRELSDKIREKLNIRNSDGTGIADKLNKTRDELIEKVYEYDLNNKITALNLGEYEMDLNRYLNYPNRKLNEYIKEDLLGVRHDPFENLVSVTNTCEAPMATATFNHPNLDLCNLDGLDSDFLDQRLKDLKEQLEMFKEQLVNTLVTNMVTMVLNSLDSIQFVGQLQTNIKQAQCLVQSVVLQATDTESLMAAQEKLASCRKTPQRTEVSTDATTGGRWWTKIIKGVPVAIPLANPTAGAGLTADTNEKVAESTEYISCARAALGASYEKAYEKCMKGEEFSLTLDFMKTLKVDIIPELHRVKRMQCVLDREDNKVDYFTLMAENIKQNFKILKHERNEKYKIGLKEALITSSKEDIELMLTKRKEERFNEDPLLVLFLKEKARQCIAKKLEAMEQETDPEKAYLTPKRLEKMQNACINDQDYNFVLDISDKISVKAQSVGKDIVFEVVLAVDESKNNFYKVSYNKLNDLYERVKLELKLDQINLENILQTALYMENDRDVELFMGYYNSKDGISTKLFNEHLNELDKKIGQVEPVRYNGVDRDSERKSAIEKIAAKCYGTNKTHQGSAECLHFQRNRAKLKMYGGIVNAN